MQGEGTIPDGLPPDPPPQGADHDASVPTLDVPGTGPVRLPMLTVDSEPATPEGAPDIGRIPHPQGRPVVVELPTDPAALSAEAFQALAGIADALFGDPETDPAASKKKPGTMARLSPTGR